MLSHRSPHIVGPCPEFKNDDEPDERTRLEIDTRTDKSIENRERFGDVRGVTHAETECRAEQRPTSMKSKIAATERRVSLVANQAVSNARHKVNGLVDLLNLPHSPHSGSRHA